LLGRRADEHVAREQAVPGLLGDDAHGQTIVRIGAGKEILDEDVAAAQVRGDPHLQPVEDVPGDRTVDITPPDVVGGGRILDDEAIERRTTGARAGEGNERAVARQPRLAALEHLLIEGGYGEVPVSLPRVQDLCRGSLTAPRGCRVLVFHLLPHPLIFLIAYAAHLLA